MGSWSTTDLGDPDEVRVRLASLESELREADRLVDDLFRSNPQPMWIVDPESLEFLDVNEAAVARYGYTRDQFLRMTLLDVRPEHDRDIFWDNHRRIAGSPWVRIGPVDHVRVDGSIIRVEPTVHDVTWRGRPARLARLRLLSAEEIAEQSLVETSGRLVERLTAIVDVWRDLSERVFTVDELMSAAPEIVVGLLGADVVAVYVADGDELVPVGSTADLAETPRLPVDRSLGGWVFRHGVSTRSSNEALDPRPFVPDGVTDPARSLVAAPVPGDDSPRAVIVAIGRRSGAFDEADERTLDLLARSLGTLLRRIEAQGEVVALDERLQLVVDATTDAIYDWQVDADTVWWSPGAADLFGHPKEYLEASVERWVELIHVEDRERIQVALQAALDDPMQTSWVGDYRFRRGDGSYVHIRDRSRIRRHPDGRPWRLVGGMTDISELVEAERRMLQSQRLEAVGQLTGGVAHDFNNLLTVVLGNADQMIADIPDDRDDLVELAETVRSAAVRGADLARQLLAFARRQPLDPRSTDVDSFVDDIARLLRRTIPENIRLDLLHGADVPDALVDRSQLESALVNLCLNARDAMPSGGRLWIATDVADRVGEAAFGGGSGAPGPWVVIRVGDTGTGIPPELLDRVVEPFFTTKALGAGTGLGLSMVHGFVSQSGGHLTLRSRLGLGTLVSLYLPASTSSLVDAPSESVVDDPVSSTGEQVLVVEDDPLVRQLAVRQLRSAGYEVVEADSGPAALAILAEVGSVDLLFTDVVMPGGMDGRALAEAVQQRYPSVRVLYTSGYSRDAIVRDGRLEPGVELLVKPYHAAELVQKVRGVLDGPHESGRHDQPPHDQP